MRWFTKFAHPWPSSSGSESSRHSTLGPLWQGTWTGQQVVVDRRYSGRLASTLPDQPDISANACGGGGEHGIHRSDDRRTIVGGESKIPFCGVISHVLRKFGDQPILRIGDVRLHLLGFRQIVGRIKGHEIQTPALDGAASRLFDRHQRHRFLRDNPNFSLLNSSSSPGHQGCAIQPSGWEANRLGWGGPKNDRSNVL